MPIYGNTIYPYTKKGYKDYKEALIDGTGKPTGQGFGAARKGPSVVGPETDVICDYEPGKIYEYKERKKRR